MAKAEVSWVTLRASSKGSGLVLPVRLSKTQLSTRVVHMKPNKLNRCC